MSIFMIVAAGQGYFPILVMIIISSLAVAGMLAGSFLLGPGRQGKIKSIPFESGVDPIGSARWPFHARFYLLAILFLLFDVELIFFYPWAVLFQGVEDKLFYLIEMGIFSLILVVALAYAWARGVFDWR